jgi:hypothetical protein
VAQGQVFSEYFHFIYQLLHIRRYHPSFRSGTVGQMVADVPSELILTPPQEVEELSVLTDI